MASRVSYKPGWKFRMGGSGGRYLCVTVTSPDSSDPTSQRNTQHMREVPDLDGRDLVRWVFDFLLDVERHEAAEFFAVEGHKPFMPHHQDEGDPYAHVERWP
jgi:hypothetical protein